MTVRSAQDQAKRATRRAAARRTASTVVVLAVTAALTAFGTDLVSRSDQGAAPGTTVALGDRSTTLVCPGPVTLSDPGSIDDEGFSSTPVGTKTALRTSVVGAGTSATLTPFTGSDDDTGTPVQTVAGAVPSAQGSIDSLDAALVLRTATSGSPGSAGSEPRAVTASVASSTAAGDLQGVAAAGCQAPGISQWLVGGSTELGSSTRLVLQNPSRTPATVTIALWGAGGELDLAGPSTYLVPPSSEVTTLLEGLAAEQRRIAVHVSSTGALVSAYLQHNVLEGLTPRGVDLVVPGDEPATAQTLVGLEVEASAITDTDVASLRILAPGDTAGTASVRVLGADGQHVLRGAESVDLAAGEVTDVSLAGLPAGRYSVVVQADVPVVAAAQTTRTGRDDPAQRLIGIPKDRAWVAARHVRSDTPRAVALPTGTTGVVVLTALPAALDGDDTFAADVPIVYSSDATVPDPTVPDATATETPVAPTDDETPSVADPDSATWTPERRGELRAYGTDGSFLGSVPLDLAVGQTVALDLATLDELADGQTVAAVMVVPTTTSSGTDGTEDEVPSSTLDWSVLLSVPGVSGATAVILPAQPEDDGSAVVVRRSVAVGLRTD